MSERQRHLSLEGEHNVRDLGGYPRRSGGETAWGQVYRACGMARLTPEGQRQLRALGIRTVIDLRSAAECSLAPGPFATHPGRRRIGLFDGLDPLTMVFSEDATADFSTRYISGLETRSAAVAEVMTCIAEAPKGPVLFHCSVGKDRTGLIAALLLLLAGVPERMIIEDYALTGRCAAGMLEDMRGEILERGADPAMAARILSVKPAYMARTLEEMNRRHGGARGYLSDAGCPASVLDAVAARLDA